MRTETCKDRELKEIEPLTRWAIIKNAFAKNSI